MPVDLSGLKPLHTSPEPAVFHLAWGWWIMIFSLLLSAFLLFLFVRFLLRREKRLALTELKHLKKASDETFISNVNALLKRAAIIRYGSEKVASLYGKAWLDFLNKTKGCRFPDNFVELLEKNLYAGKRVLSEEERKDIGKQASLWIKKNL